MPTEIDENNKGTWREIEGNVRKKKSVKYDKGFKPRFLDYLRPTFIEKDFRLFSSIPRSSFVHDFLPFTVIHIYTRETRVSGFHSLYFRVNEESKIDFYSL